MSTFVAHPRGNSWHRDDFFTDMLEEGDRPLLLLEACQEGDEVLVKGRWTTYIDKGAQMTRMHLHTRTKRPLPA